MLHSRATCSAVRGASPVTMATRCADCASAVTTTRESARVLHSKAARPHSSRSRSTSSRRSTSPSQRRDASARTRSPRSARPTYAGSNHAGACRRSAPTASGEPLTSAVATPSTSATTDMRWSADEKWKRRRMRAAVRGPRAVSAFGS